MEFAKNDALVEVFSIECGLINFEYCARIRAVVRDKKIGEFHEDFRATFGECGEWNRVDHLKSIDVWDILESKELIDRLMKIIEVHKTFNPSFERVNI